MKNLIVLFLLVSTHSLFAQSTYTSANYAAVGDTIYLTKAQTSILDFDTTGQGISWNYGTLTGVSQSRLVFRSPSQTGFSALTWPYIFNSNNTNLSATNGESVEISGAGLTLTNPNAYFKKTNADLRQVASAYKLAYNNLNLSIKNQFSTADVLYRFPVAYENADSSTASFVTEIPATYYQSKTLKRKNVVDGWGVVVTPFGTFQNALRLVSTVQETDSFALLEMGIPKVVRNYRELKWLDPSRQYPVLVVTQNLVGGQWITSSVDFLDEEQFFQPVAIFAYTPTQPIQGLPVNFQNLSTNANDYFWDFGDPESGSANTSTEQNPEHIFSSPGTYTVRLIAINEQFSDTIEVPVQVYSNLVPEAGFTFTQSTENCLEYQFSNTSTGAQSYVWNFGDTLSPINASLNQNPTKRFSGTGLFVVQLIASNGSLKDTLSVTISVQGNQIPQIQIVASANPVEDGESIIFSATPVNGGNNPAYQWQVNGQNTGNNSPFFELANPQNNQTVQCLLTSSSACANPVQVVSNEIVVLVNGAVTSISKPIITPPTGTFTDPVVVTISCETPGTTIYYTTSGNIPVVGTGYTKMYASPFSMIQSGTIRAIAVRSGLPDSPVAVSVITITNPGICATPVIAPGSGTYGPSQMVSLSCTTSGAALYYTTNGNTPVVGTSFTKLYTAPFFQQNSATIRALAVKSGLQNSPVAVATLIITNPAATVATPSITPLSGTYGSPQTVTLSTLTLGATIYYTTNGNVPRLDVPNSFTRIYSGPFVVSQTTTVRAIAVAQDMVNSAVAVSNITIGAARYSVANSDPFSEEVFDVDVFPNPTADGIVNWRRNSFNKMSGFIRIIGSDGRIMAEKKFESDAQNGQVDLGHLSPGVYMMLIADSGGINLIQKRIVKK